MAAHCREASRARSDAEFCSKLGGLLQEADESTLWAELLEEDCGIPSSQTEPIRQEAHELIAIFTTILAKVRRRGGG